MLAIIFCILASLGFSILITYFLIPIGMGLHYFLPFILLIPGYVIGVLLMFAILWLISRFFPKNKEYKKPNRFAELILREMCKFICIHLRVKVKAKNEQIIPNQKYLFICNHRSNLDPIIMIANYSKNHIAFISKEGNAKIPLVGHFMMASGYFTINRDDKLQSLQVMKNAGEMIKEGIASIGVYPEGTRSKGKEMNPFHEGVFAIAKIARCPIVVASIQGTELVNKNIPWRKSKVTLKFLEVLDPIDYVDETSKDVSDYCFKIIHKSLDDLR